MEASRRQEFARMCFINPLLLKESLDKMHLVKRKIAFEHAQNGQIKIILCMRNVAYGHLLCNLQYLMILLADSKGQDQTARMRRLIWAFAAAYAQRRLSHDAAQKLNIMHVTMQVK